MSSIIYSPGRFSDHSYDERFANEGSGPRNSDFSVSNGHEQFKSDVQSPQFHKDIEFNSPSHKRPGSSSSEDVWFQAKNAALESNAAAKGDADGIRHPQVCLSLLMNFYICLDKIVFFFIINVILKATEEK